MLLPPRMNGHIAPARRVAALAAGLVVVASACGPGPASAFVGHWHYTSGATTTVCGSTTSTAPLTGSLKITHLHGTAITADLSPTCKIDLIVGTSSAVADPNQSCAECVPADTCATLYQWTFSSFVLVSLNAHTLQLTTRATAQGSSSNGTPDLTCEQTQDAILHP